MGFAALTLSHKIMHSSICCGAASTPSLATVLADDTPFSR